MNIKKDKYYVIAKYEGNKIVNFFNLRVYTGRYVMSAYNQIPNNNEYKICEIKCTPVKESK